MPLNAALMGGGRVYLRKALISMWIPKGAALIRGNTVFLNTNTIN